MRSLTAVALLASLACGQEKPPAPAERLARAKDWLYQLQELDPDAVRATKFDVLVTDPSKDGTDAALWDEATVAKLRTQGDDPAGRVALAYLSVGEAEDYRGYWKAEWKKQPPAWLGEENPDWKGNYAVRFWDPAWKAIVLAEDGLLARVLARGWDGVYLDVVDVYERWADKGELSREEAARRMVAFVRDLAAFAREKRPDFLVLVQNAPELAARKELLEVISGLGLEDTFFWDDRARKKDEIDPVLGWARAVLAAKKPVFAIDYCRQKANVDRFYARAREVGFVPYASVRGLDRLVVDDGHAPE